MDYAMGRADTTWEDLTYLAKGCLKTLGKDYDKLPAGEQRAWQNAMLILAYRKQSLKQDILERVWGRNAYDVAAVNADRYEDEIELGFASKLGSKEAMLNVLQNTSAMMDIRCRYLGLDPREMSAETIHAVFVGMMADMMQRNEEREMYESFKAKAPPELWKQAMDWNQRYEKATGGVA